MTLAYVAGQAGVNPSTLHRIEKGETEPGGENILNLMAVVRGSYEDARRLWSDRDADEAAGRELADQRLAAYADQQVAAFRERVGTEQADAIARRLVSDPGFVDAICRAAQQLLDE